MSLDFAKTLKGTRIELRKLNIKDDLKELYAASHDGDNKKIFQYLLTHPFPNEESYGAYLTGNESNMVQYTVVDIATQKKIGLVNYINIAPEHRRLELGNLWYTPAFHRTYANTEAIYLLLRHAFEDLNIRRVEWKCNNLNEPSKKAALRLGFKFEGLFRQHFIIKGENRDTAWYSIIDTEWEETKQALLEKLKN